jgi:hypothetical protein
MRVKTIHQVEGTVGPRTPIQTIIAIIQLIIAKKANLQMVIVVLIVVVIKNLINPQPQA